MRGSSVVVALAIGLAALSARPTQAAVDYVDRSYPQASDTNPGSEALPWQTIQHAAGTLVAGDTVWLKAERNPPSPVAAPKAVLAAEGRATPHDGRRQGPLVPGAQTAVL